MTSSGFDCHVPVQIMGRIRVDQALHGEDAPRPMMGISYPLLSLTVGAAMMMLSEETGRNGDIESCYTHIYIIGLGAVRGWSDRGPDRGHI